MFHRPILARTASALAVAATGVHQDHEDNAACSHLAIQRPHLAGRIQDWQ
jgi:hypothetical protein